MPQIYFSSAFSDFSISAASEGEVTLTISDLATGRSVFTNKYFITHSPLSTLHSPLSTLNSPPSTLNSQLSTLLILGLDRILELDIRALDSFHRSYNFSVSADEPINPRILPPDGSDPVPVLTADVIHCTRKIKVPAAEWLRSNLLLDQSEFTFLPSPPSTLHSPLSTLHLTFFAEDPTQTALEILAYPGEYHPQQFQTSQGWNSILYNPVHGDLQTITLNPPLSTLNPQLLLQAARAAAHTAIFTFRNSFNIPEPLCLEGVMTLSPEADSQTAYIGGRLARFDIEQRPAYTLTVENLTASRAHEIAGILNSPHCTIHTPLSHIIPEAKENPIEIIIESVDGDISDAPDSLNSIKIKFRL